MRLFTSIAVFCLVMISYDLMAQDTLILINGRAKPHIDFLNSDDESVFFYKEGDKQTVNGQGLMEPHVKDRTDVFEVILANGKHEVMYRQDSLDLTLPEADMTEYIHGARRGWKEAKNNFVGPLGYVLCGTSVFAIGKIMGPFWSIPIPFIYAATVAVVNPKVPEQVTASNSNPYYAMGYQDIAKVKKIRSATFWGVGGLATGFILLRIIGQ